MKRSKAPRFSIGIPAYKPDFLDAAIASVLGQSTRDFELIVSNMVSPRKTELREIVKKFNDKRIRYIEEPVHGVPKSVVEHWNVCVHQARGEYFVLLSDDDLLDPMYIERMQALAKEYPRADVLHCRVRIIDESGRTLRLTPLSPRHEDALSFLWHRIERMREMFVSELLFRTRSLKRLGGFIDFPLAWGSDDATLLALGRKGGIAYSDEALCSWRRSAVNISNAGSLRLRIEALDQFEKWAVTFLNGQPLKSEDERLLARQILSGIADRNDRVLTTNLSDAVSQGNLLMQLARLVHIWIGVRSALRHPFKFLAVSAAKVFARHRNFGMSRMQ